MYTHQSVAEGIVSTRKHQRLTTMSTSLKSHLSPVYIRTLDSGYDYNILQREIHGSWMIPKLTSCLYSGRSTCLLIQLSTTECQTSEFSGFWTQ